MGREPIWPPAVYVTGASGVLGSEIVHRLALTRRVTAVSRRPLPFDLPAGVALRCVPDIFESAWLASDDRNATIIHCAGLSNPRTEFPSFAELARDHILNHVDMMTRLIARGWRGRLVFLSSGGTIYGDPLELPIRESHPTSPKSFYGLQKLCLERAFADLAGRHGFEFLALRVSNPFGSTARKAGQGVIPILVDAFLSGAVFKVLGDGTAQRDYLYISDFLRAIEKASTVPLATPHIAVNISSGKGIALNDIIDHLGLLLGRRLNLVHVESRHDVTSNVLCNALARDVLNWQPQRDFKAGVQTFLLDLGLAIA